MSVALPHEHLALTALPCQYVVLRPAPKTHLHLVATFSHSNHQPDLPTWSGIGLQHCRNPRQQDPSS